ncbi:MAG: nitrophenyl compound nitroreductase subunit ArsF family protein [Parabacteroides sp.]|jgi:hypothetical protein|uniref:nitrophenyl compound nitroreductase subunit ArsF family protein n=1 Tax=Macellibacteroides sp. TaxID=2014584 RepID=UPI001B53EB34|nr:hypothetical protein [Parabacteroides sp.]MDD4433435.1 nitrophenyl compound nitroreductase subunit ArsF family protein [Parabacteroides sp.]
MKQFILFGFALFMLLGNQLTYAQADKSDASKTAKVEVYYFHLTRRCQTCQAVESGAKQAMESLYANQIKKGDYTFKAFNLDDKNSEQLAKRLNIGGQALVVVSGTKKIDITNEGFLNARKPEKLKEEIRKAVNTVLK